MNVSVKVLLLKSYIINEVIIPSLSIKENYRRWKNLMFGCEHLSFSQRYRLFWETSPTTTVVGEARKRMKKSKV